MSSRSSHHQRAPDAARRHRALTQRIFLIEVKEDVLEFYVLGSTGDKIYTVTFNGHAECSCPDYENGNLCKHIIFVWIKVLDLDPDAIEWELDNDADALIREQARDIPQSCYVPRKLLDEVLPERRQEVPQRPITGESCPVCFDDFEPEHDEILYCRYQCGHNIHRDCYEQWSRHRGPTCVMCRSKFD